MAWRIHRERVFLAGWGRAILLQIAHPKVARGVAEHSGFTTDRWGRLRRLHRTLSAMLALTFGSEEEAGVRRGRINAIHDRVHGQLDRLGGRRPVQRPRSRAAHLGARHADSTRSCSPTGSSSGRSTPRGRPLLPGVERDRGALGIPPGLLPRTESGCASTSTPCWPGVIEVTDTARRISREIIRPPAPALVRPALWLAALPAVGLLPPAIRAAYGFPWDGRRARALRGLAAATRGTLPLVPPALRYWATARRAESRLRTMTQITLRIESPRQADVARLVEALDVYQSGLYPPESNHFLDLEGLAGPSVRFFVARGEGGPWAAARSGSTRRAGGS